MLLNQRKLLTGLFDRELLSSVFSVPGSGGWWDTAALIDYNPENSRYFFNGAEYDSLASFLTAIGGVNAGAALSIGPVLVGDEVYESDFSAGVNGWIEVAGFEAGGTLANSGGNLVLTNTAAYRVAKNFVLAPNRAFQATGQQVSRTGGASQMGLGVNSGLNSGGSSYVTFAGAGAETQRVIANSDNSGNIYLGVLRSATAGVATMASFALQEAIPYQGFIAGEFSFDIDVTMPSAFAGNKVIAQWGISDEDSRVRLVVDGSGNLSLIVIAYTAAAQSNLALGTMVAGQRYRIRGTVKTNAVAANVDGALPVVDAAVLVGGIGLFWIGRSPTGETFDGTIHRVRIYPTAMADVYELANPDQSFRIFGDSTAVGVGSVSNTWYSLLAAKYDPDRLALLNAAGGESTAQMLARAQSEASFYQAWHAIIMDRPNTGESSSDWIANVKATTATRKGTWLIVPPLLNSPEAGGDASQTAVLAVQAALVNDGYFEGHTFEGTIRTAYLSDLAGDETRADGIHLNDFGQEIQANYIYAWHLGYAVPIFTSPSSGLVVEEEPLSFIVTTDLPTTKVFIGGPDDADYEIVNGNVAATSHIVRWAGNGTKDYEAPDDTGSNNVYDARVRATTAQGVHRDFSFSNTVTNTADSLLGITLDQIEEGRTFQRTVNSDGTFETGGIVPISGSTDGQASAIQARLLLDEDDSEVVGWTTIDASPTADSFAGELSAPQGGPYRLEIRDAVATTVIDEGTTTFKLGLLAIGLNQSNMGGMYTTFSSPPALDPLGGWFDEYNHVWTNTPNGNGVRELMNAFVAGSNVPMAIGNPTVGGVGMGYFLPGQPGWDGAGVPADGPTYRIGIQPLIEMMGGDIEIVFLRGGEGEANGAGPTPLEKKNSFKTNTIAVTEEIEALVGHPVTVIMAPVMTTTIVGGTTDAAWDALTAAVYELSQSEERFILSTSAKDSQRVDEYHANGASHGEVGKRFGQSLLVYNGDAAAHPAWHIVSAEIVDATHTRLTLAHSMGDDFTPATDITDFTLSADNGASYVDTVGSREDATHIVLEHEPLATNLNRAVRYQYGMALTFDPGDATLKNPVLDGMVFDNGPLASPLFPSAGRSIVAPGFAADPTPTWAQTLHGATGGGGGGQNQQWTGVDLSSAVGKKVHMQFVRNDSGTFADIASVIITPAGGSAINVNAIEITGVDGTGTERWAGLTTTIPDVPNLNNCTVDLHYTSNPFAGTFIGVWIVPDEVEVVAAVYAGGVVSPAAPYVASVDLETEAGGFICAAFMPMPASDTESGVLTATWGGDTPDVANRYNYDSYYSVQRSMADVSGTAAALDTTITATFAGIDDVSGYRLLAVSFR